MRVLVSDPIHEDGIEKLEEFAEVDIKTDLSHDELLEAVPRYDAMIVRSGTKVDEEVLDAGENLKLVVRAGVGLDNIDLNYADEKSVRVENTPTAPTNGTSELAIGLMFSWAREIPKANENLKKGKWVKSDISGTELAGKTLGVIGTGRIGTKVAEKGSCLGMSLLGFDPEKNERFREIGGEYVDLDNLLENSDFISLHVPLNDSTKHLIGEEELEKMKKSAVLVNTSRGAVVDERALISALEDEEIGGACLDVHEKEPSEKEKLLEMSNVILTPHIGATTIETQKGTATLSADKIREILA